MESSRHPPGLAHGLGMRRGDFGQLEDEGDMKEESKHGTCADVLQVD